MRGLTTVLSALLLMACVDYSGADMNDCETLLECNPGRTCGLMVACVDGACEDEANLDVPCARACADDPDCPAGMHCVWKDISPDTGYCRLDGLCDTVAECDDYAAPGTCAGAFECAAGLCRWNCGA